MSSIGPRVMRLTPTEQAVEWLDEALLFDVRFIDNLDFRESMVTKKMSQEGVMLYNISTVFLIGDGRHVIPESAVYHTVTASLSREHMRRAADFLTAKVLSDMGEKR